MPIKIEKSTLVFLQRLAKNNDRDWFHANKEVYQKAKDNVEEFVATLSEQLAMQKNVKYVTQDYKIFRINRDVRFSKNKDPYKTNFGAIIGTVSKDISETAGFYLHIDPKKSFVGGGLYQPSSPRLADIRRKIASSPKELEKILNKKTLMQHYKMDGDQVKTTPKGYPKDHPAITLLRFKSFVCMRELKQVDVLANDFLNQALKLLKELIPFNNYLNEK